MWGHRAVVSRKDWATLRKAWPVAGFQGIRVRAFESGPFGPDVSLYPAHSSPAIRGHSGQITVAKAARQGRVHPDLAGDGKSSLGDDPRFAAVSLQGKGPRGARPSGRMCRIQRVLRFRRASHLLRSIARAAERAAALRRAGPCPHNLTSPSSWGASGAAIPRPPKSWCAATSRQFGWRVICPTDPREAATRFRGHLPVGTGQLFRLRGRRPVRPCRAGSACRPAGAHGSE